MTTTVFVAVIFAAIIHSIWNGMVKKHDDKYIALVSLVSEYDNNNWQFPRAVYLKVACCTNSKGQKMFHRMQGIAIDF